MVKIRILNNSDYIGKIAEEEAIKYLKSKSYKIIKTRYRPIKTKGSSSGEIDIISLKDKTLIFTEVKSRNNENNLYYSITQKQKNKIIISALEFIKQNQEFKNYDIRFDVILILNESDRKIKHIKNAFSSEIADFPF